MAPPPDHSLRFAVDRGGTFTDVVVTYPAPSSSSLPPSPSPSPSPSTPLSTSPHRRLALKLLSVDPSSYADAPREGIRRLLEAVTGVPHPASAPLSTRFVHSIRMGTTVATNALLERTGARTALVTTRGFADLLRVGNQARPRIFSLDIVVPDVLYERVVEVDERVVLCGASDARENAVQGTTGEWVSVQRPLDLDRVRAQLQVGVGGTRAGQGERGA